jgi:hypothetical protein
MEEQAQFDAELAQEIAGNAEPQMTISGRGI